MTDPMGTLPPPAIKSLSSLSLKKTFVLPLKNTAASMAQSLPANAPVAKPAVVSSTTPVAKLAAMSSTTLVSDTGLVSLSATAATAEVINTDAVFSSARVVGSLSNPLSLSKPTVASSLARTAGSSSNPGAALSSRGVDAMASRLPINFDATSSPVKAFLPANAIEVVSSPVKSIPVSLSSLSFPSPVKSSDFLASPGKVDFLSTSFSSPVKSAAAISSSPATTSTTFSSPSKLSPTKSKPLDDPQTRALHRGKVIEEIVSSEQVFHGLLLDFLQCYYVALCAEREHASVDFMSRSALVGLCTNIEQISAVSAQLLSELTNAVSSQDVWKTELGPVFLNNSSLLRLYGQYAENHSAARHDLKAMTQSPSFRALWDRTETEAMLGRGPGQDAPRMPSTSSTLDGYLILPIQRVPRYLLLLRELIKITNSKEMSRESENLAKAVDEIASAATYMNDCIWRAEQKEILRDLQAKFVGTVIDFIGGVGLAGYRALVFEGELVRMTSKNMHRTYHFHLMNDALVYSRANGSGGFKFHRALPLTGSCNVADAPAPSSSSYENYCGAGAVSCAFKIITPEKSFVVYAATVELKKQWMQNLENVIRGQSALLQAKQTKTANSGVTMNSTDDDGESTLMATEKSKTVEHAAPIIQHTADKCQMCRGSLFIFSRRLNCERCGLLVCGTCGGNSRVLPGKQHLASLRQTSSVCCACALEMDGSAIDSSPDEFRLKIWVQDVQSLVGGVGGHTLLDTATTTDRNAPRHGDAVEALKRLYFTLTATHGGEEQHRGPSNAGTMGVDGAFSIPVGLPSDVLLTPVVLHVHMLGVGEIGKVPIRVESIVTVPEVTRAQPFYKWHVVAPNSSTTACSTLAITLIQPAKRDFVHTRLSEKERGALKIGLKVCFELHVPPSLWGAHFIDDVTFGGSMHRFAAAGGPGQSASADGQNTPAALNKSRVAQFSSSGRLGTILGSKSYAANAGTTGASRLDESVTLRLKRFASVDDPAFTVGGTQLDVSLNLRAKLNVSLLSDYEKRVERNPTIWGMALTDTMYSDCLAHYGNLAKTGAPRYSDTQLTMLNRLHVFHSNPMILSAIASADEKREAEARQKEEQQQRARVVSGRVLESRVGGKVLIEAAKRQESQLENSRTTGRNVELLKSALKSRQVEETASRVEKTNTEEGADDDDEDDDGTDDAEDREVILRQLYKSEKEYLEYLITLDEVFVSRLLQVAQGSDIRLATAKNTDVWAEKMGLSERAPTMTTGIQVMNTGVLNRAKSMIQTSSPTKRMLRNGSSTSNMTNGVSSLPSGEFSFRKNRDNRLTSGQSVLTANDEDEDDVTAILKQPFVTVLMQSVGQIRTVNAEFLSSLSQRLDADPNKRFSESVHVGDVFERFAAIMPVYSTYATHHPFVLEELTDSRNDEDAPRRAVGARAKSQSLNSMLTACEANPRCEGRGLEYFLNLPLERVETYRAALSALLMCTPQNHPDWNRMRLALGRIVESTKHMTRAIRRRENMERLREIESFVDGWPEGFQLVDNRRWLVREGSLVERQTFGRRESHRLRYFWLFSDCIVIATRSFRTGTLSRIKSFSSFSPSLDVAAAMASVVGGGASSSNSMPATQAIDQQQVLTRFKFKRLINIGDLTICDLPHGVQSSLASPSSPAPPTSSPMAPMSTLATLGDMTFAFCIACVTGPSFVVLVPNNPADCCTKSGPAPVELARVGPPSTTSIATGDVRGRAGVVYEKAVVKSSWITDILLCVELHQRKAVFDDDDWVARTNAAGGVQSPTNPSGVIAPSSPLPIFPFSFKHRGSRAASVTSPPKSPHQPSEPMSPETCRTFRVDNPNTGSLRFSPSKLANTTTLIPRPDAMEEDENTNPVVIEKTELF